MGKTLTHSALSVAHTTTVATPRAVFYLCKASALLLKVSITRLNSYKKKNVGGQRGENIHFFVCDPPFY